MTDQEPQLTPEDIRIFKEMAEERRHRLFHGEWPRSSQHPTCSRCRTTYRQSLKPPPPACPACGGPWVTHPK